MKINFSKWKETEGLKVCKTKSLTSCPQAKPVPIFKYLYPRSPKMPKTVRNYLTISKVRVLAAVLISFDIFLFLLIISAYTHSSIIKYTYISCQIYQLLLTAFLVIFLSIGFTELFFLAFCFCERQTTTNLYLCPYFFDTALLYYSYYSSYSYSYSYSPSSVGGFI